jgi:hypothetical protein
VKKKEYYNLEDRLRDLARLFDIIGEKTQIKDIYLTILRERWNPADILRDIDEGYKLTGDNIFLDKKLELLELEGRYDEAERVAAERGKLEKAKIYHIMQQMVQEIKSK